MRFPYPETHYCDSKVEDPTNVDLSRPLPTSQFPQAKPVVQPAARPSPPGSTGWVTQKSTSTPTPARGAWGKGAPANIRIPPTAGGNTGGPSSKNTSKTPTTSRMRSFYCTFLSL